MGDITFKEDRGRVGDDVGPRGFFSNESGLFHCDDVGSLVLLS